MFGMVDVRFEGDYNTQSQKQRPTKNSRITQFFIDKSFGLLKTPEQAMVAEVVVAIVLFCIAGYMFSKSGDTAVPVKTPQELIDATLPTLAR